MTRFHAVVDTTTTKMHCVKLPLVKNVFENSVRQRDIAYANISERIERWKSPENRALRCTRQTVVLVLHSDRISFIGSIRMVCKIVRLGALFDSCQYYKRTVVYPSVPFLRMYRLKCCLLVVYVSSTIHIRQHFSILFYFFLPKTKFQSPSLVAQCAVRGIWTECRLFVGKIKPKMKTVNKNIVYMSNFQIYTRIFGIFTSFYVSPSHREKLFSPL